MIKVELEINGRKVKIEADNAQDIADAVRALAEKEKEYVPVYPYSPPHEPAWPKIYPYSPTAYPPEITWWKTSDGTVSVSGGSYEP
jgi:hypothetical protein